MFFDKIIYGTQYYRAPTPLENEWEDDMQNIKDYGFDAIQLRLSWRWYEKKEGEYDFSSIDRLFDIAEKNGRQVIVKFMLECAPQYIFD
ncbi:MAG: beta-galactosidase, partial [Clostridia bacterium]|nr:beta-galactosidase [Clostridia bacterium]